MRRALGLRRTLSRATAGSGSLAVAVIVAACGGAHQAQSTSTAPRTAASSQATKRHPATSANGIATVKGTSVGVEALDAMFPRSGEDVAIGAQLGDFDQVQATKVIAACMRADALPAPPLEPRPSYDGLPGYMFGNAELPNLAVIKRTLNIGVTRLPPAPASPTVGMSSAKAAAYVAALRRCDSKPASLVNAVRRSQAAVLSNEWMNIIGDVIASAPVQALNRKATACVAHTRFPASSVTGEITKIEGDLVPLNIKGKTGQARATNAAGTRVFLRCFGPEVRLTVTLLTKRRSAFFAKQALAIDQIQADIDRGVANLQHVAQAS